MHTIRGKLLLAFGGLALLSVGGMALAGYRILRARAVDYARVSFRAASDQLDRSLRLRYDAFVAMSDMTYVLPIFREVGQPDAADFGLGTPTDDTAKLKFFHDNLVASDFNWARVLAGGSFGIADFKGRVVYTSAAHDAWGADARVLPAVAAAFDATHGFAGAMVVRADDPRLAATQLLGATPSARLVVLFARATVVKGTPKAVFLQVIDPKRLLDDVALGDAGTALALVAPDGTVEGSMPPPVLAAGLGPDADGGDAEVEADGARWLVQRRGLPGLPGTTGAAPIATIVVARNLDVGLALLLGGGRLLLIVGSGALLAALLAAAILSLRLSRPIVELEAAARKVGAGDLRVTVTSRSRDEIGRLAQEFGRMVEGLRERDNIKTMFKAYLAPDVVEYLLAHPEAQKLGGERRVLTVMFSDLVGFTALSETRDPADVVQILNTYLGLVSRRIAEDGGTVDKYIGDAVMAFFGAPVPRADHAARACRAALDHLAVLEELSPRWKSGAWPLLDVRIGLNTGEVVVGNIGSEQGLDYTVIGDEVNLASRIEGANKIYGTRVLMSDSVYERARDVVDARALDVVQLAGRTRPVVLYQLMGARGAVDADPARRTAVMRYAEGRSLMGERKFAEAARAFAAATAADPSDGPAAAMRKRADALATDPPPPDWDGVHHMTSK
ncbi:MAG TPA: adenylate/guanylate cyclase domain-containing protein [Myxococcota bacterium]|jgi:class 3 adenylate cyclase|nr:adenylate/guanylate cyclase domain-containing protein [Myxococcota bacterium]